MRLIQIACETPAAVRDRTESLKPAEGASGGDGVVFHRKGARKVTSNEGMQTQRARAHKHVETRLQIQAKRADMQAVTLARLKKRVEDERRVSFALHIIVRLGCQRLVHCHYSLQM